MLKIEIQPSEIFETRRALLAQPGHQHAKLASRIGALRKVLESAASSFSRKQASPGGSWTVIPDGRLATIEDHVFSSWSDHSFPYGAAILHGIQRRTAEPLNWDENSYIIEIRDGPDRRRRFGELTMLACYEDATCTLTFMWIGPVGDLAVVRGRLRGAIASLGWDRIVQGICPTWSLPPP